MFQVQPGVLRIQAFGSQFGAAEAGNVGAKLAQPSPSAGTVWFVGDERFGGSGVVEGDPMSQPAADGIAQGLVAEGLFIIELLDEIESVLADEPVAVAAMPPLGQVDFVEGAPVEVGGEHGLDFGDRVEPFEDGVGLFAVVEAAIELLTDVVREACDFSAAHGLGVGSKVGSLAMDWVVRLRGCRLMRVSGYQVIIPDRQNHGGTESFSGDWESGLSGHQDSDPGIATDFLALVSIVTFLGRRLGLLLYARPKRRSDYRVVK